MPMTRLPPVDPAISKLPVEKQLRSYTDLLMRYRRELEYIINGNLDEGNVIRAKSVSSDWVYAGNIMTDQLIAGEAKISTALIENLVVGNNVTMGPEATISWLRVENKPFIPSTASDVGALPVTTIIPPEYHDWQAVQAWVNSGYATNITSTGVYTGTIVADRIYGGTIRGVTIDVNTNLRVGNTIYLGDTLSTGKGIIFNGNCSISNNYGTDSLMISALGGVVIHGDIELGSYPSAILSFFGSSGSSQQSISLLPASASLGDVIIKLNGLMTRLGYYGMFSVS